MSKHVHPGDCMGEDCALCQLAATSPKYQQLWGLPVTNVKKAHAVCDNLGEYTGERVPCETCKGTELKVFSCKVYGECTRDKKAPGLASCKGTFDGAEWFPCPDDTRLKVGVKERKPAIRTVEPTRARRSLSWAYGVTSIATRLQTYLPETLASLRSAGFDKPTLFVDDLMHIDAMSLENHLDLTVVARRSRLYAYGNWLLGLMELHLLNPQADRYVMFQDDIQLSQNLVPYLESIPYPDKGYCNLYTDSSNEPFATKKVGWFLSNQKGKGAQALMFSREAVQRLLLNQHLVYKMTTNVKDYRWKNIDGGVKEAMANQGWKEYVHNPSLVQHVGKDTTLKQGPRGHTVHADPIKSLSFRGNKFNAMELLRA